MATLVSASLGGGEVGYASGIGGSLTPDLAADFGTTTRHLKDTGSILKWAVNGDFRGSLAGVKSMTLSGTVCPFLNIQYYSGTNFTEVEFTRNQPIVSTHDVTIAAWVGPKYIGKSANAGTSAFNLTYPSARMVNDKSYIAVETANQAQAAPTGYTEVQPGVISPQFRGTAAAAGGVRLTLFERTLDGTEAGTVSIPGTANHKYAVLIIIRPRTGETIQMEAGVGSSKAASFFHEGNPFATTVNNCTLFEIWATDRDSAGPNYATDTNYNSAISPITTLHDAGTATGVGGGIAIFTGEIPTPGSYPTTFAESISSVAWCAITLALKSVAAVPQPLFRGPRAWSAFYKGTRSDAQIYKGAKALHA